MQRVLLECAIRAALIAGGTAVVLGVTRVKTAAARHVAWAAVVVMMLTLPVWTAWGPRYQRQYARRQKRQQPRDEGGQR